jgi:hypothetical protein
VRVIISPSLSAADLNDVMAEDANNAMTEFKRELKAKGFTLSFVRHSPILEAHFVKDGRLLVLYTTYNNREQEYSWINSFFDSKDPKYVNTQIKSFSPKVGNLAKFNALKSKPVYDLDIKKIVDREHNATEIGVKLQREMIDKIREYISAI